MAADRIKLKDLATELGLTIDEVQAAVRDCLKNSAKVATVVPADADKLRQYFQDQKNNRDNDKKKPDVIVRRRRREASPQPTAQAEKEPVAETPSAPQQTESSPVQPKEVRRSREVQAERKGQEESKKARIIAPPAPEQKARVIRLPGQDKADAKEQETAEQNLPPLPASPVEEPLASVQKSAPDETVTASAEQREEEQTPKAEEPRQAVKEQENAEEVHAKTVKLVRRSSADASAEPEGSSAPTLTEQKARPVEQPVEQTESQEEEGQAEAASQPRVRIISRPTQKPQPAETSGANKGRERNQRSGQARRDQNRSARPGTGFRQQQPVPMPEVQETQSKKKRMKGRRTVDFQQGDFGQNEDEDVPRMNRSRGKRKGNRQQRVVQPVTQPIKAAKRKIRIVEVITVSEMAKQMGLKANELIKVLFSSFGVMATINQTLDFDTATLVASEFGYEVEKTGFSEDEYLVSKDVDSPESLKPRPPVVTIMGHVDHGKTSLLDAIRKSHVTSGEAGGITQHIGAYHVKTKRGDIVFLDTPGHEAFTAMRARGAQITDLVILVVAADDGVMEQTREAINHSRAANVPIMVAVNKMDKPGADPDRVLRELAELGLQPEDWGGDTIVAKVSAKTRQGLDELLEMVALQSEIMELKANPDKPARGHIVEARLDKGRGPVATVLIQEGTLHHGDNFVCGQFSGRVRALLTDQGKKVKEAGPSMPVEVQGVEGVPEAGEEFIVVADEKVARRIADARASKQRERELAQESRVTLETFLSQHAGDQETMTLNLVVKADVQGSLEAIIEALNKQSTDKVAVHVVHGGTGAISESDILLASASQAIIIGFNVRPTAKIKEVAERENVDIRFYNIIYKLVEDIKSAMAGLLAPVQREVYLGQAEVRNTFNLPKVGTIAGCYVADGKIQRHAGVRLLRDGVVVYTGKIISLKRFKDDAKEVVKGNECGAGLENFNDIKIGDIIEAFETVEEAAQL
ncbi:MAG: translation initiation factor IF-2 [Desulfovibrio sp.]|nr:translation initiation factor IF-2 [Desulfovibrio sp.]